MRLACALAATMLVTAGVAAQQPAPVQHPYGLDPFNPTDAALLRNYGGALVTQTPLLELHKLDPYNPSDAALLRQIGGGIPLWGWWWNSPVPAGVGPLTPFPSYGIPGEGVSQTEPPGVFGPIVDQPLPPTRFDAARLGELSTLPQRADQARPRVCTIRMGDRVVTC